MHKLCKVKDLPNLCNFSHGNFPKDVAAGNLFSGFSLKGIINEPLESRDSSVGIVLGYGLDDRGSRIRFSAGDGKFSLHHRVQNGSGAHPAS
jgi:hypothetical protein